MANLLFYMMSMGAIIGSLGVVCAKNPIASVLSLLGTFFCLATIYLLSGFEFLAAAQILVYGGAVMVLFLFVVMLLNLGSEEDDGSPLESVRRRGTPIAIATSLGLALLTFVGVLGAPELRAAEVVAATPASFEDIATLLFGSFLLPFEIVSILLLAAAIAVIVLAKRERPTAAQPTGEAAK